MRGGERTELLGVFCGGESGGVFVFDIDEVHDRTAQRGRDPTVGSDFRRRIDRFERITETIAGGKEDLGFSVYRRQRRRRPLPAPKLFANLLVVAGDKLSGMLVEHDQAGGQRIKRLSRVLETSIAGANIDKVAMHQNGATGDMILHDVQRFRHVILPHNGPGGIRTAGAADGLSHEVRSRHTTLGSGVTK